MPAKTENKRLIERFLFGEMPEEERFGFEERFITDAELFEEIRATEDDLIEKYVRDWMTRVERTKFEKSFLTTKKRCERVQFTRQMIRTIENNTLVKIEPLSAEDSLWQKIAGFLLTPKLALTGAFVILVAVFGVWILSRDTGGGNPEVVKTENTNAVESPTPSKTPENNSIDEKPLEDKSAEQGNSNPSGVNDRTPEKPEPKQPAKPAKTPPVKRVRPPNPVLALFPGRNRSGSKTDVLNLPKSANGANLRLNLESVDYKTYRAVLSDPDGNVIFQKSGLKPVKSGINLFIPAKNLTRGDYLLKLYGRTGSGEDESVADFQFRVNENKE